MIDLLNWLIIVVSYFSSVICSMLLFTARNQIPEQTVIVIFWLGLFVGTIGLIIQETQQEKDFRFFYPFLRRLSTSA